jgi:hypothetical protein
MGRKMGPFRHAAFTYSTFIVAVLKFSVVVCWNRIILLVPVRPVAGVVPPLSVSGWCNMWASSVVSVFFSFGVASVGLDVYLIKDKR